ncbi:MAG: hypothetical protein E7812_04215 [Phenylobacterium sp.]|nr:MAG: hypothetical protein E7812_04215 [Phenylobacterium sp.]
MNTDTAREDLAFMRALVAHEDRWQQQFGKLYFAAGLCYSVQMLLHVGQFLGVTPNQGLGALAIGWGPTVVFLGILIWTLRRNPAPPVGGATSRAVGSVFGAVGLSNLALALCIGSISLRLHSVTIWLIYPCVVMVLQGLAWLVAYMLRRRLWLGAVAFGWFAVGVAMALFIDNMVGFVLAAAVGIFCFMLLPGLYIMRQSGRSA